jgi:hypothetical protein
MRRSLALLLLIWGAAVVVVGGANVLLGNRPPETLAYAIVGGGLMLGVAWWLDRPPRSRGPRQRRGPGPADRRRP